MKITDLKPALTQVKLESKYLKHLSGTKVLGDAKLFKGNKEIDRRRGEILFFIIPPNFLDIIAQIFLFIVNFYNFRI